MSRRRRSTVQAVGWQAFPELERFGDVNWWTLAMDSGLEISVRKRITNEQRQMLRQRYKPFLNDLQAYSQQHPDKHGRRGVTLEQITARAEARDMPLDPLGVELFTLFEGERA